MHRFLVRIRWMVMAGALLALSGCEQGIGGSAATGAGSAPNDRDGSFPTPSVFVERWNRSISDKSFAIVEFRFDDDGGAWQPVAKLADSTIAGRKLTLRCDKYYGTSQVGYDPKDNSFFLTMRITHNMERPNTLLIRAANPSISLEEVGQMMMSATPFNSPDHRGFVQFKGVFLEITGFPALDELLLRVSKAPN